MTGAECIDELIDCMRHEKGKAQMKMLRWGIPFEEMEPVCKEWMKSYDRLIRYAMLAKGELIEGERQSAMVSKSVLIRRLTDFIASSGCTVEEFEEVVNLKRHHPEGTRLEDCSEDFIRGWVMANREKIVQNIRRRRKAKETRK